MGSSFSRRFPYSYLQYIINLVQTNYQTLSVVTPVILDLLIYQINFAGQIN